MIISRIYKFLLISLIFLVFQVESKAQESPGSLVLDSLVQAALKNNPEILSSQYMEQAAEFMARSSGTLPDPKFSIAALNLPKSSLSLDETPMSGIVLGLSQTIPWPGTLKAKKAIANLNTDSKKQTKRQRENSVARMVRHFYYDYSFWTKAEQIVENNIDLIEFLINIADSKYSNGIGSAQDALRAQTTRARLENKKLLMEQMSQTALLNLGRLLNDSSIIDADIPAELPEQLIDKPLNINSNNPQLAKAEIQNSISAKKLALAKSAYYPNFTFGFDYRIRKDMPMDAIRGEDFVTFKAGFQLPLWFFAKQNNETKAARLAHKATEENYRSAQNQLEQQIGVTKITLRRLSDSFDQYKNNIKPQAMSAYEAALSAYQVGDVDFNALLTALLDLLEIDLERNEILKNYWQKSAELTELSGER